MIFTAESRNLNPFGTSRETPRYSHDISAASFSEAEVLSKLFGFQMEDAVGHSFTEPLPSHLIEQGESKEEILHAICYLCYRGMLEGSLSIEQTLGDRGVLHEWIHHMSIKDYWDDKSQETESDFMECLKIAEDLVQSWGKE